MPIAPPPVLGPVHDQLPIGPANRADAEQLAHDAADESEKLTAAPADIPREPASSATLAAPSMEPPVADITASASITPQRTLPPAVPLGPVSAPAAEARLAAAPAPAPIPMPEPVTVTQGRSPEVQPSPAPVVKAIKANLPAAERPPAAPPLNKSAHPDLIAGQAHFTKGDLPAARRAFAKAMDTGLPEAALALGNTFDPVSLAKVGLKDKGDPAAARRWYRRAFELAMTYPRRSRSTLRRADRRGP